MRGRRTAMLLSAFCAGVAPSGLARAQQSEQAEETAAGDVRLEEIVVTGTRTAGRTVADSPVPIDVFSASDLEMAQGSQDLNLILRNLVPSFNFPEPALNDATDAVRPASLRGLSPDQTLVLVNSTRRHRSAQVNVLGSLGRGSNPVDLSLIPSNALQRVEVLRDGASAQYGSDAIAGIINLILKEQSSGFDISGQFGQFYEGDGESAVVQSTLGLPLTSEGFLTVSTEFRFRDHTDRSGDEPRAEAVRDLQAEGFFDGTIFDTSPEDVPDPILGTPEVRSLAIAVNGGIDLSSERELYFFGTFNDRRTDSQNFFFREPFPTGDLLDGTLELADLDEKLNTDQVPEIFPSGFQPILRTDANDFAVTIGSRGRLGLGLGIEYDGSFSYGKNKLDFELRNSLNASLGAASPTRFDTGELENREMTINLDFVRPVAVQVFAGDLNIAFGFQYRQEEYEIQAGEPASFAQGPSTTPDGDPRDPFSNGFPGFRPEDEQFPTRDSVSIYADLEADITDRWLVGVAGRFEHFSDFGETTNGKLSTRYDVVEGVLSLRGSIESGFRAPSLGQSFFTRIQTVLDTGSNTLTEEGIFPVTSPAARVFGAEPLDPEESLSISSGLVFTPVPDFSLEIDFYHVEIDDRIILTEDLAPTATERAQLDALGLQSVQEVRFFVNGVDSTNNGIDIVADYGIDLAEYGHLQLNAGFNYNDAEVDRILTPQRADPTQEFVSRTEVGFIEDSQPDTRLNLSAVYSFAGIDLMLRANRFDDIVIRDDLDGSIEDEFFPSEWVLDAELAYSIADRYRVAVGVNNFTDQRTKDDDFFGFIAFDGRSPIGFNGGFWYIRAGVSF